jgi:hypothetical protein
MDTRALFLTPLALLAGCGPYQGQSPHGHGRYEGIGIGPAGDAWRKLADAPKSTDAKQANLGDDDYLIVVTDSQTGEVRECGDRSGFCIRLDPWRGTAPTVPLAVTEHTQHKSDDAGLVKADESTGARN